MNDLVPILLTAIVFITIYKIFELFVKRKERIAMIEKIATINDSAYLQNHYSLSYSLSNSNYYSWSIRIGLLLVGISLGIIVAIIVDMATVPPTDISDWAYREFRNAISALYPACATLFGGAGLIIAYFIERKHNKEKI